MKQMQYPIKTTHIKELEDKTILQIEVEGSHKEDILKYQTPQGLNGNIAFDDGRRITAQQRKKLYATFKDIAEYTGDIPEYIKEFFKFLYCAESGQEYFSLSDCNIDTARELINYVIEFVIMNDIPLTELAIERTEEIGKYLFYCLKYQKCSVCGIKGTIYTLDKERNKMCLCDNHHDMAKAKGLKEFSEAYKIYGIQFIE